MHKAFNKLGSIELNGNTLKYRISIQELGIDDKLEMEKEIKRKISEINEDNFFVLPFQIEVLNRYMVLYYDLTHFVSLDYLREIPLLDKIPYFLSLVKLAENEGKGIHLSWERLNFLVDEHEQALKVFLFETKSLKIYEKPTDILKTVQDLIASTMTTLNTFIGLPKRHDFIDASDENLRFVEQIYKMESLDDLFMYLETVELDLEQVHSDSRYEIEKSSVDKPVKKVGFLGKKTNKNNPEISKDNLTKTKKMTVAKKKKTINKSQSKPNKNKSTFIMIGLVAAVLILYFTSEIILNNKQDEIQQLSSIDEPLKDTFKESKNHSSEITNKLLDVYRFAYNSDYKSAYEILSGLNKKELSEIDVNLLIEIYYKEKKLSTLLDELPNLANSTVTYMYTKNKLAELQDATKDMKTKNPYIQFEIAHLNNKWDELLLYVNDVEINGRKETQIMDAYISTAQYDKAIQFADERGNPDLIKRVEEFRN